MSGGTQFGVFNAEAARARVAALVDVDLELSPGHLAAGVGLSLQLVPESFRDNPAHWLHVLGALPASLRADLPLPARGIFDGIALDPVGSAIPEVARNSRLDYIFGSYCDGPRYPELFDVEGAAAIVQTTADRAANQLDALFSQRPSPEDMRDHGGLLGALCLLRGWRFEPARVKAWESAFNTFESAQNTERAFWDPYRRRVWMVFDIIRRRCA